MLILATPPVPRESSNRRQESLGPDKLCFLPRKWFSPLPILNLE